MYVVVVPHMVGTSVHANSQEQSQAYWLDGRRVVGIMWYWERFMTLSGSSEAQEELECTYKDASSASIHWCTWSSAFEMYLRRIVHHFDGQFTKTSCGSALQAQISDQISNDTETSLDILTRTTYTTMATSFFLYLFPYPHIRALSFPSLCSHQVGSPFRSIVGEASATTYPSPLDAKSVT